jgi:hypothetical protein
LPDASGHAKPHGIDKCICETGELFTVSRILCNHHFTPPLTVGRALQQVLASLGGDEYKRLLAGKQANRSINK